MVGGTKPNGLCIYMLRQYLKVTSQGRGGPSQGGRPKAAPQWCSPKTCAQSKKVYLIATNSFVNHPHKNRSAYCILTPKVAPSFVKHPGKGGALVAL